MDTRTQMKAKVLAASVAAVFSQMAGLALADSAVGQDTVMSSALNRRPINTSTAGGSTDPEGMGTREPAARTPSGQMYDMPIAETEEINKTAGGWEYFGHVEAGVLGVGGDKKRQGFKRYKDVDGGLYINSFGLTMDKPDSANFFEISGGAVAKDDQFYSLQFGRYNDWRVRGFYNETQHVFTTTFRSIYDGVGTGNLTLKPGLTAGGTAAVATDNINVAAVANANPNNELGLVRTKGGVRFDMNLTHEWKAFASYTNEKRKGARPFGSVWTGAGGSNPVETVEPIDYNSHDLIAGLQFNDALNSLNLQLSASWFRNHIDTLTFQNPYRQAAANGVAAGGFTQGRFDLYPNNDYYNVKGEYARSLPDFYKGRFTSGRQAESLHDDSGCQSDQCCRCGRKLGQHRIAEQTERGSANRHAPVRFRPCTQPDRRLERQRKAAVLRDQKQDRIPRLQPQRNLHRQRSVYRRQPGGRSFRVWLHWCMGSVDQRR
jgi:hypothetical protein